MNKNTIKIRDAIIEAALPNIVFDGWTWDAIEQAAITAGYDADMARAVFPGRLIDALAAFSDLADRQMLAALSGANPEDLRIRDRVREALIKRYEFLASHKEALKASLAYLAFPTRKPRAAKMVWSTADHIWDWAGDTATDYNRYTKRGLLSGIIVSTTLVWINDESRDMQTTKDFIDRRIENVMQIGKVTGKVMSRFKRKKGQAA